MKTHVRELEEFETEAARFARSLAPNSSHATLVTLSGELGAGKTAFTKAVARTLGIEDIVNSPTFVLEKMYVLPAEQPFKRLIHIDAYRLEKGSDLAPLGFYELYKDSGNLILLEWPERVADTLAAATHTISIVAHSDSSRAITYG